MSDPLCPGCARLRLRVEEVEAQRDHLRRKLAYAEARLEAFDDAPPAPPASLALDGSAVPGTGEGRRR